MKRFLVAFVSIVALVGCGAAQLPPQTISASGRPVVVTSTNEVPSHRVEILGVVRDNGNYNGCGNHLGTVALQAYPNTDAVVGYREQAGANVALACNGTAVRFVN